MKQLFGAVSSLSRRALMVSASAAVIATMTGMVAQAEGLGTPDKPVEVRMIANEAFANQWQTLMVPEFNKHYPNVKVTIDGVPYVELLAKSMLDATGPSPTYDIIIADDPWVPQLASVGALLDLRSEEVKGWTSEDFDWDDFNVAPLAASEWDGVQYGVPVRSNMLMMFVNKSLYEKAGVPVPTPKLTWNEFLEQAPKLVQDTNGDGKVDAWAIDTYFVREPLTPTIWQTIMNSNGGSLLDENGKPAFNNEIGVAALETHKKLLEFAPTGAISHGFSESLQAFRQGMVATHINWGSVFKGSAIDAATTTLTPEQVGIQVLPMGSKSAGAHRGIWSGAVSAKSENPEAAWAVLQWLSSKEGEKWHSANLGVFPARKSTLAAEPSEPWLVPVFDALQQAYDAAGEGKMWRIRHPRSDAAQQVLADEHSRFIAGQVSAEEALNVAAEKIEKILK
ncbi:ABC transporter substrate-binding protein [Nitratireductor aestuarii]|uniref:ABC transporter substrate-binding protein n=1 Tax=Nitratireductor aestuarii TaxID=1735103 RepID=A0A916RV50_9HYPH|nr:sugar ABC transporter substrate-binding protein [Nitratireductor aestuarii]GGA71998.1 ABC transporter substrate-binding protein [Nitratireductor aestuarii]